MQNSDKRETLVLQGGLAGSYGSKITFTIGSTYMLFGLIGFAVGAFKVKPPIVHFPNKRLLVSYYFNNMMSTGLKFANNSGGAAFLYSVSGFLLTKLFEEEIGFF